MMRAIRSVGLWPVLILLTVSGCGGEAVPYYDGSQSSAVAGAPEALAAVGADLISADTPEAATLAQTAAALEAEGLRGDVLAASVDQGLASSPETIAGVVGTVSNLGLSKSSVGRFVVLVFDEPVSAVVFASQDSPVFADLDLDTDRQIYFSGNLVGYYAPENGVDKAGKLRGALETLAEVDQP